MTLTPGHLLTDRYRIDEVIASGGMGTVWRATDELLGRRVAIKVLHAGHGTVGGDDTASAGTTATAATGATGAGEDFHARFRAEARSSAALSHPNIATVFDFGDDDTHPYLVMELVEGSSLAQVLAERGALPADEVASILGQAALALEVAHTAGVIHRDVKPANIMLTAAGLVKLTDFGIARVAAASGLTRTGEVLGTPHYLSPEQAQGQPATAASDIYALGVVGHELLTGTRPFNGESMVATALAHVTQAAPELPETVPESLRTAIMAALAKDPSARPAGGGALAAMLGMPVGPVTPPTGFAGAGTAVLPSAGVGTEATSTEATSTEVIGAEATGTSAPAHTAVLAAPPVDTADPATSSGPVPGRGGRRPWWLVPVGAAAVILAIVVTAMSLGGSGDPNTPSTQPTTPETSQASVPTTSTATTTTTTTSPVPAPKPAPGKGQGKGGKKK